MLHKIKNDSYSTQWHTRGFQNIKLVSRYSKSVSRKNSKCLDFVLVQATHLVQKAQSLFHATQNQEMTPFQHNGIPRVGTSNTCSSRRPNFSFMLEKIKKNSFSRKWHTKGFQNIQLFPIIQGQ